MRYNSLAHFYTALTTLGLYFYLTPSQPLLSRNSRPFRFVVVVHNVDAVIRCEVARLGGRDTRNNGIIRSFSVVCLGL